MSITPRVALVTGGSRGIGQSMVAALLANGYRVATCARAGQIGERPDLLAMTGNITDSAFVAALVDATVARFGRIDTLVNNAGIFLPRPFTDYSQEDFSQVLAVNLGGFFNVSQCTLPHMLRQGGGHIVTITSSLLAEQPLAELPAALTALTKGGLNAVTRSLAIEYAERGIRVNAIAPGVIRTPMHHPDRLGALAALHPIGRVGETSEVAQALLFLDGAGFITGEILHLDGGAHAGRW